MAWLLDTNVLSELRRPRPGQRVVVFVAACPLDQLHISVVTLAEIRFGIELVAEPNRRSQLNEWLKHKVRPMFDGRVLQVREDIMLTWRLLGGRPKNGTHIFSARPDDSGDGHPARPNGCHSGSKRLRESARSSV
jgi:predicted nucleic acid-binding protein